MSGHNGMVGGAIMSAYAGPSYDVELITASRSELDLTNQNQVQTFIEKSRPDIVIIAAAKVGGIHANNTYPADFIYENIMIQTNLINASFQSDVKQLLFLGSSCIYPRNGPQPLKEEDLLSGYLEKTNQAYAIAKIAGIELCQAYNKQHGTDYRALMPTNLYGPGDTYHLQNSHVIPAMIKKFYDAKLSSQEHVVLWGTGTPLREFLYVQDLADICLKVLDLPKETFQHETGSECCYLNVGCGLDITIKDLANMVSAIVGFNGSIIFDSDMPDGTMRKVLDVSKLNNLGIYSNVSLESGLKATIEGYINSLV